MPEVKKHLRDLYRTSPAEAPRKGRLLLDMNEGVHGLPAGFIRAIACKIDPEFMATYPSHVELLKKIASHNHVRPENICLGNGSDGVIKYIFEAYISEGDKVLLTNPTFAMYPVYCKMFGAKPIMIDYKSDLTFPVKEFMGKLKKGIKMAVVVNPNNPTGDAIAHNDLVAIIKKADKNGILTLVDEAYFYYYPKTAMKMIDKYENLIVLRTFSKLCALANARVGYAAASPGIIQNLKRVKPSFDVDGIAALFASALLDRPHIISDMVKRAGRGSDYLSDMLKKAGIGHIVGNANFILIKCGSSVNDIIKKLEARGILVNGNFKQPFLKEYLRVTVGDRSQMELFWKAFLPIWKAVK